ncbi:MAG TPA: helix-hairpin-helix domain-containing protein [Deltaproteobacteria bacterium]|nr:helix-hairpin-helix domain-containing protein [Deltaproteobacteria bacterium]
MKKYTTIFALLMVGFLAANTLCASTIYWSGQANVNTATYEELKLVPGMNYELAQNIIDYRDDYGQFTTLDDLRKVPGMTKKFIRKITPYIKLDGKTDIQEMKV